jgi:sec-independent protein translocase protein TatC
VKIFKSRRRAKEQFERAADGSMSLLDHLRELRDRLFKASIAVVLGMFGGWFLSGKALDLLQSPYCTYVRQRDMKSNHGKLPENWHCTFVQLQVTDTFTLRLKIALWVGLIIAAPFWLYQLWAFIAPGLHKHERRWAYWFAGIATPLFALGALVAYFVVEKGLIFLLQFTPDNTSVQLEITAYVEFVTNLMLLFGVAFEFPLVVVLFNLAGLASAKRLMGWWRIAVFLTFVFAAVATPTPDPFGMSFLALALSSLYFAAVGFAYVNDRRRSRATLYPDLSDDQVSKIEPSSLGDPGSGAIPTDGVVEASGPVTVSEPVTAASVLDRFDDTT